MKALCFSKIWTGACQHLRLLGPLRIAGGEAILPSQNLEQDVQDCDLLLINRQYPVDEPDLYDRVVKLARKYAKSVVYETDDLLIDLPKDHPEWRFYSSHRFRYITALLQADHVLVTNEQLSTALQRYNKNILVMPNYLDDSLWHLPNLSDGMSGSPVSSEGGGIPIPQIIIGYMGTVTHTSDLQLVEPALVSLLNHYDGKVKLKLWGVPPVGRLRENAFVQHESGCPGEYDLFVPYFQKQSADIFIAPLAQNRFNSCKSFLKYLEYSASGVPGVFGSGGQYDCVVRDGENGFLAGNLLDWYNRLSLLIENQDLRRATGRAALEDVAEKWLLSSHAEEIARLFEAAKRPSDAVAAPGVLALAREASEWASDLYSSESTSADSSEVNSQDTVAAEKEKHARDTQKMMQRLVRLRAQLSASQRHSAGLDSLVVNLTQSWAWRVGTAVTEPARNLRRAMGKRPSKSIETKPHA